MTILEALRGINAYPIPYRTLETAAVRHGLQLDGTATQQVMAGSAYKLACTDLLYWLSTAPNITQGGQSYSFTDEQRQQLRNQADALAEEADAEAVITKYGYKGSRL